MNINNILLLLSLVLYIIITTASDVQLLTAAIIHQSQDEYLVSIKLQHEDTGWDHYADEWRIVDQQGTVLGTRVLLHPHVQEQLFTRALSNVKLDDKHTKIYIEAHDKQHGWAKEKLEIDFTKMKDGKLIVKAP